MFYGRIPDVSEEDVLELLLYAAAIKPNFAFLHYEIAMTYMQYERQKEAFINTLDAEDDWHHPIVIRIKCWRDTIW